MRSDTRIFLLSLAASLAAHAMVVGLPGWRLPELAAPPPVLQAQVVVKPRPAAVAAPAPRPLAPRRPAPAPVPALPVPAAEAPAAPPGEPPLPVAEEPPPAAPEPSPEPPLHAPPVPAAEAPLWPHRGRIVYDVYRGDQDFLVGRTEHRWEHDGAHYRMEALVETTGMVALFRAFRYIQRSEGRITPAGLEPRRFSVEQAGKPDESAEFDWARHEVTLRRAKGPRVAPIKGGDQDVLSLWHQLTLTGDPPAHLGLTLVTTKAATPAELTLVGVEAIGLPLGQVIAHHLRARALDDNLTLDIWLAEKHGYLPVRILIRDKKGESLDQRAREVERETAASPATTTETSHP
ncbi:MAG: DUF3108 domain-containing protein [Rhodocyclaceae bacterium]|jgi:hypothetical protein|nr:DUF3108 domain-containing protein [Rhodocyclaceae bacterium]